MSTKVIFHNPNIIASPEEKAEKLFEIVSRRNWVKRWQTLLSPRGLMVFDERGDMAKLQFQNLGQKMVALQKIRGTMNAGRALEFDEEFRPNSKYNRERWVSLAAARRRGANIPPVKLIQVGDLYFVEDGHHRISVAHALEDDAILADITVLGEQTK